MLYGNITDLLLQLKVTHALQPRLETHKLKLISLAVM